MTKELAGVEGVDYVTCLVCGGQFKELGIHLVYKHKITKEQYLKLYPNSLCRCSNTRKKHEGENNPMYVDKIRKICPICLDEFFVLPFEDNQIYCSPKCVDTSKKNIKRPAYIGKKISESKIGHEVTDETRKKISETLTGTIKPEIQRQHQSASQQGIPYDEWDHYLGDTKIRHDYTDAIYLNDPFPGSHRHHLTKTIVAHIPPELHRHIYHRLNTGRGMAEMNMLALQFINGCYND